MMLERGLGGFPDFLLASRTYNKYRVEGVMIEETRAGVKEKWFKSDEFLTRLN